MNEFEQILLKKLLYSGEFFGKAIPIIEEEFFSNIGNQQLFKLSKEYYGKYKSIPTLTELVASVKNVPNAEIRAEIVKSLQVVNATEEVENLEFMLNETVEWVRDNLYMDALQIGSDGLMRKDDSLKLKAQEIMDKRAKISIDTDLGLDFDSIDEMIAYYSEKQSGILTQHKQLNYRLGPGFLPGTLSVICASSGVGKSLMMTDLISGIIKKNKNVLLVSLELSSPEVLKRVHANAMDLPINSLLDLNKSEGELNKIRNGTTKDGAEAREIVTEDMIRSAYSKMKMEGTTGKLFVKDYAVGSLSPIMLEQLIESYKIERNIEFDIVFVDYMGLMKSDLVTPAAGLYSYVKSIGEETRAVSKKLNIPIVTASQLNRSAVGDTDGADNSAISDSLGTIMTADFIIFLLQDEDMKSRNEIVCKITKNRFTGNTSVFTMNIDYNHMRFNDMIVQDKDTTLDEIESIPRILGTVSDDFGLTTTQEKVNAAGEFAEKEIKDILVDDMAKIIEHDKNLGKSDPFKGNSIEDMFAELGI